MANFKKECLVSKPCTHPLKFFFKLMSAMWHILVCYFTRKTHRVLASAAASRILYSSGLSFWGPQCKNYLIFLSPLPYLVKESTDALAAWRLFYWGRLATSSVAEKFLNSHTVMCMWCTIVSVASVASSPTVLSKTASTRPRHQQTLLLSKEGAGEASSSNSLQKE